MPIRLVTAATIALGLVVALSLVTFESPEARAAPATFDIDASHSAILFKINHLGVGHTWGRFNSFEGSFTLDDGEAAHCAVECRVDATSVDTGNDDRDTHLEGPDFFNAKEFPSIAFKSTKVVKQEGGFDVTGDLTLHGVTKSVTARLIKVGEADLTAVMEPLGYRAGFEGKFTVKRSEFGMTHWVPNIGDEVTLILAFEGKRR